MTYNNTKEELIQIKIFHIYYLALRCISWADGIEN